jgi:hypothetical protein
MKRLALTSIALLALGASAGAQTAMFPTPSIQIAIAGTVAARTALIAAPTGKQIVVTALMMAPVATSAVLFTYGTGTNCGTGTTSLSGTMTFSAGQALAHGSGNGPVMIVPNGNDLCVTISTAAAPGTLVYTLVP